MSIELPPIGAKIRTTTRHDGGPVVVIEGVVTAHPKTSFGDERWVIVGNGAGVTAYVGDLPDAEVAVEILSAPEPADGTWLTAPNRIPSRPPYVFHRDDAAVLEAHATLAEAGYRWYFHEDSEWTTWANVQGYGAITVIKDGGL